VSAQPPAKKTAGQIEKETLKKRISNNEYRMSNVEGMYSIFLIKEMERSDSILRNSLFVIRYSAVRCLTQAIEAASLIKKETVPFWRSFTRATPLAASVQSDRKRNFVVLNLLFLDCGSGF